MCEQAGIPSASLVCEGFLQQAKAVCMGLGMKLPVAHMPGHVAVQPAGVLEKNILEVTLPEVIACLTRTVDQPVNAEEAPDEPGLRDIVFRGSHDAVNEHFQQRGWSDGLPIVPPTLAKIEAFLAHTGRKPEEVLGVLLPEKRTATVWSVAVNGVMSGCRPEYMPLLLAMVEAMADPAFGVEHAGATPGGDALVILTGPIVKRLGFNFGQGVMRDGFVPNTSVGRFWRMVLRNVAGFRLHGNDKATYGNTWRVVVAENADCLQALGWPSCCTDTGFADGESTVSIANYTGGNVVAQVSGDPRRQMLPYLADAVVRQMSWQLTFSVGAGLGRLHPLVLITPILAEAFAVAGITRSDIQQYLFEHARMRAEDMERLLGDWSDLVSECNLAAMADKGTIPQDFHASDDPDRMVPLVWKPADYSIVVTGDPLRNNAYVFSPSGLRGYRVTRRIDAEGMG